MAFPFSKTLIKHCKKDVFLKIQEMMYFKSAIHGTLEMIPVVDSQGFSEMLKVLGNVGTSFV